jgi:hypothetical protein
MDLTHLIQVELLHIILQRTLGIGIFHLTVRPPQRLYRALRMGNIETVLSSSISAVLQHSLLQEQCGMVLQRLDRIIWSNSLPMG